MAVLASAFLFFFPLSLRRAMVPDPRIAEFTSLPLPRHGGAYCPVVPVTGPMSTDFWRMLRILLHTAS